MITSDWSWPTAKQDRTRKVQITSLPDEWGQRAWAGHLCANKQKASGRCAFRRFWQSFQLANGCYGHSGAEHDTWEISDTWLLL